MNTTPVSKAARLTGWVLGILPALLMMFSGVIKLVQPVSMAKDMAKMGLPASVIFNLGIVEIACVVIYLFPRTSVLGAILVTGYMGGATLANLQQGGPAFVATVIIGVMYWGGLYLRDPRIRALIPLRS